jgi:hypothetical protein
MGLQFSAMEKGSSASNALDLAIKYAAAAGAVCYGVSLCEQLEFLQRLGVPGDLVVLSPRHFFVGAILLSVLVVPGLFGVMVLHLRDATKQKRILLCSLLSGIVGFASVFSLSFWLYGAWVRDALSASWPAFAFDASIVFFCTRLRRSELSEQAFAVFLSLVFLYNYGVGLGMVQSRGALAGRTFSEARLLISADAVRGAEEMGLVFPSSRTGEVAAQLSGPVEVIFEGDHTYVLRVQGHLAHLSKEKVLGSVP